MTELYFVRHGQSEANLTHYFAGHTDVPLTSLGKLQAEATAKYFDDIKPDIVYASSLKRAYDTGLATAERFNIKIIPDDRLREIFAGEWEGKTFENLEKEYPDEYFVWKTDIGNAVCNGGESVQELGKRVIEAVEEIISENQGKKIVFAVHATPIRLMECYMNEIPLTEAKNVPWVSNASVTCAVHDGKKYKIIKRSEDGHLEGISSVLPANV